MSQRRRPGKSFRLLEVGVMVVVVALVAYFGAKKVQEYRQPKGRLGHTVDRAIDATKQATVAVTTEMPRSFVRYITDPGGAEERRLQELDRRIEENPQDEYALYSRYINNSLYGEVDAAQADLERLVVLESSELTAANYNERAYHQASQERDFAGALPRAETAVKGAPEVLAYQDTLAYIYVGLGRNEEAVTLYNKILEVDPDFPEALWGRGTALERLGQSKKAGDDFAKARRLDPYLDLSW